MCKKSSCVVPVILLIIIACLCTYIFLCTDCKGKDSKSNDKQDTVESKNENTNVTEKQNTEVSNNYTYDGMKGFYSFNDPNPESEGREELATFGYTLYLSETGTFKYQYAMNAGSSVSGNYIIVDDEIRLNYIFESGNDAALIATNGSKVLKIKDKNTLVDDAAYYAKFGGAKTINLTKDNNNIYGTYSNQFDLNYLVNNYILANNSTR